MVQAMSFVEIIEHFNLQNKELIMDQIDDDAICEEEQFFALVAGSINKLG